MKRLKEEDFSKLTADGKVDRKGTIRLAAEHEAPEEEFMHPLVAQSRAMTLMAEQIAKSGGNIDVADAMKKIADALSEHSETLAKMMERNTETVMKMMTQMIAMQSTQKTERIKGFKIKRNENGFLDTIDFVWQVEEGQK